MAKQRITITELNPQPALEVIPGYTSRVRFTASGRTVGVYQTMSQPRPIKVLSGEVLIIDEGKPGAVGSVLDLPAPSKRGGGENGADGSRLGIISGCKLKHTVRTPPNVINGQFSKIELDGVAAVEFYAINGQWAILHCSPGVKIS